MCTTTELVGILIPGGLTVVDCLFLFLTRASRAVSSYYGTEIEIWAGFGPVGNTEKKHWADYEQLLSSENGHFFTIST